MIIGILGQSGTGKDTMAEHLGVTHRLVKVAFADPMKRFCQEVFGFSSQQLWGASEERNAPDQRYEGVGRIESFHNASQRLWELGPKFIDEMLPFFPPKSKRTALTHLWLWFDRCAANSGFTARFALQTLGTEWGRTVYEDVWVRYTFEKIIPAIQSGKFSYRQDKGLIPMKGMGKFLWGVFGAPGGVTIPDMRFPNEVEYGRRNGCYMVRLRRVGKDGNIKGGVENHQSETLQKSIPDRMMNAVLDVPEGIPAYHAAIDRLLVSVPKPKRASRLAA